MGMGALWSSRRGMDENTMPWPDHFQSESEALTRSVQSHSLRRCHTFHSSRVASHSHHAPCQSSHHRLRSFVPRSDPQLCRERHNFKLSRARHLACAAASAADEFHKQQQQFRQPRLLWRRHLAQALPSPVLHQSRWDNEFLRIGQSFPSNWPW